MSLGNKVTNYYPTYDMSSPLLLFRCLIVAAKAFVLVTLIFPWIL